MIALKENIHPQKRKFNRIFNKIMLFCKDFSVFTKILWNYDLLVVILDKLPSRQYINMRRKGRITAWHHQKN